VKTETPKTCQSCRVVFFCEVRREAVAEDMDARVAATMAVGKYMLKVGDATVSGDPLTILSPLYLQYLNTMRMVYPVSR
jgi:hypothetical protein